MGGKTFRLARNDGENHLHGGLKGFDKVRWHVEGRGNTLVFNRVSPAGEENYPGNLAVGIAYTLTDDNALHIVYDADTDADTVVNLTNHSYFNLNGKGSVLGHYLQVFADAYTECNANCLPTGRLCETAGTPFDFKTPKQLGRDINGPDAQLKNGGLIGRRDAICLETQIWPNATSFTHFPSPILRKHAHYHSETVYRFEVMEETRR